MATSGTVAFNPSAADFVLNAFARIGMRGTQVTNQHVADAAVEANLVQVDMANKEPNLWKSELISQSVTSGTATYTLSASVISFMAVYLNVDDGGTTYDRILMPISTFEYASIPNKATQAPPTSYWFNRQSTPQITLWPTPDDSATYVLKLQALTQIEDVSLPAGTTLNLPYRWLDCFTAKLAHRLARIYRPDLEAVRKADADEAWAVAAAEDVEYVPFYVIPSLGAYRS